jgi:SAM-dependent methyltransferase
MTSPRQKNRGRRSVSPSLGGITAYYAERIALHGPTPAGVDWNSRESQQLRFEQLLKVAHGAKYSLNDLGCGYGALYAHIAGGGTTVDYRGFDVSSEMIEQARNLHGNLPNARFSVGKAPDRRADYTVASGIFNVKLETPNRNWLDHVLSTLGTIDRASRLGFAFNCLTKYSDRDRMRRTLYYADPCKLFDYCKRRFSSNVALLHDYGLYEFTVLVRKGG